MQSALVIKQIDDYDYILREQFGFRCADEGCCKTYTVPKEVGAGMSGFRLFDSSCAIRW